MADLSFTQSADPVAIFNDTSGNQLIINPDGSINSQELLHYQVGQGKVFTLSGTFNAAIGGADNPIFLIKNPNASGKILKLRKLLIGCTVNNVFVEFTVYYNPTITTNGTSQTPRNNLIGSATASIATAFSLPTLSSLGTKILDFTMGQNSTAPEVNLQLDLQANQNIVIAAQPGSNNRAVQITVIWAEV